MPVLQCVYRLPSYYNLIPSVSDSTSSWTR
jgi:hypothetical protein